MSSVPTQYLAMPRPYLLNGEVKICAVQPTDIESIRQWRNAQMDVLRQNSPIDVQQQIDYYTQHIWPMMSNPKPPNILLSIFQSDKLIGYGGLVHINWMDKRAEVSFLLSPERIKNNTTYNKDFSIFLTLIKQLAFEHLNLHKLFTETYSIRHLHISILESNGFVCEGVLRDHVKINNLYINSIIHGCLNSYER